jgi:hypothetical protein
MLDPNPRRRPTFEQILNHPFVTNEGKSDGKLDVTAVADASFRFSPVLLVVSPLWLRICLLYLNIPSNM